MNTNNVEEITMHLLAINNVIAKEQKEQKEKEKEGNRVWNVYYLDEYGVLLRETLETFYKWEDAYKYYCELAQSIMDAYKKKNSDLLLNFKESTSYEDWERAFGIHNKKKWNCQIWREYEEVFLEESFIK